MPKRVVILADTTLGRKKESPMLDETSGVHAYLTTNGKRGQGPNSDNRIGGEALGLSDGTYLKLLASACQDDRCPVVCKPSTFKPDRHLGEVCGVEVYASSVVVKREPVLPHEHEHKRGDIKELSEQSLARLAFVAFNTEADFRSIITLTYPAEYSNDGKAVKKDLNAFLVWHRKNFPGEKYLWFLEFQKRGAPHFHILSTVDLAKIGPTSVIKRKSGKHWQTHYDTWQKLEKYWKKRGGGHTSWEVVREKDGGKRYAAKYATKTYQKKVPEAYQNVGRFWGYSREGVKPDAEAVYECSEEQLREALKSGGWEYIPDDGELMHKELYQAAEKLDVTNLSEIKAGVGWWEWDAKLREFDQKTTVFGVSVGPGFTDNEGYRLLLPLEYFCHACGVVKDKWVRQCPDCQEWHTIKGYPASGGEPGWEGVRI